MVNISLKNSLGNTITYNEIDSVKLPTDTGEDAVFSLHDVNPTPTFKFVMDDVDDLGVGTNPSITIENHSYFDNNIKFQDVLKTIANYKQMINDIEKKVEEEAGEDASDTDIDDLAYSYLYKEIVSFVSQVKDVFSPDFFTYFNQMIIAGAKAKIRYPKYTLHIRVPADVISDICLRYFPEIDVSQIVTLIDDIEEAWESNAVKDILEELAEQDPDEVWYAPLVKDGLELIDNLIAAIKQLKDVPSLAEFINQLFPICNTTWNGIINTVVTVVNSLDFNDLNNGNEGLINFIVNTVYQAIYAIFGGLNGTYEPNQLTSFVMGEVSLVESIDKLFDYKDSDNSTIGIILLYVLAALYTEGAYFEVYAVTDNEKATQSRPLKIYNAALTIRNEENEDEYDNEAKAKIFEYENEFLCVSGRYGCQNGLVFDFGEEGSIIEGEEENSITTCPSNVYRGNTIWVAPWLLDDEVHAEWNIYKGYCKLSTRKNGMYIATYQECPRPEVQEIYINMTQNEETNEIEFNSNIGDGNYVMYTTINGESRFNIVVQLVEIFGALTTTSFARKEYDDSIYRLSEMSNSVNLKLIPVYYTLDKMVGGILGVIFELDDGKYFLDENGDTGIQKMENNSFIYQGNKLSECDFEFLKASPLIGKLPYIWYEIGLPLKEQLSEEHYSIDYENDTLTFYDIDEPIMIYITDKESMEEEGGIEELEGEDFE